MYNDNRSHLGSQEKFRLEKYQMLGEGFRDPRSSCGLEFVPKHQLTTSDSPLPLPVLRRRALGTGSPGSPEGGRPDACFFKGFPGSIIGGIL